MSSQSEPAVKVVPITPSDSFDLTGARGVRVGADGDLHLRTVGDPTNTRIIANCLQGEIIPVRVTRVMAATTAGSLTAFY